MYAPLRVRSRILVLHDGKFLAVKQYFGPNVWLLPGGGVKNSESYKDAAIRELYEELGVSVDVKQVIELSPKRLYVEKGLRLRYVLFVVQISEKITLLPNSEISQASWLSTDANDLSSHARFALQQLNDHPHLLK